MFDPLYMVVFFVTAIILGAASAHVRSTYRRWSGVRNSTGLSGLDTANRILAAAGLSQVQVEVIDGEITDNYDPRDKVLRLSQGVAYNASVASQAIAAHEIGHALQDARGYLPMKARAAFVPVANLGSQAGPLIILAGLGLMWFSPGNRLGFNIAVIGILLFAAILVFHVVTLPVEIDASRRAVGLLRDSGVMNPEDLGGARSVLTAAALTYVAAAAASAIQVLYWASLVFGSRRD